MNKQKLLERFASAFKTDKRDDNTTFVRVRDNEAAYSPWTKDEVSDFVREMHEGDLPNDWVFEAIAAVADNLSNYDDPDDDAAYEVADSLVDVYSADLFRWLGDNSRLAERYIAEATDNFGHHSDLTRLVGLGQFVAYGRYAQALLALVDDKLSELEEVDA